MAPNFYGSEITTMALAARSVIETEEWVVADSICLNVTYMSRQIRHATQLGSKSVFLSHHIDFLNLPCPGDAVAVNTAVWIDVRHGSYPNGWRIPCHWMDVMMPLMRAALQGALAGATDVFMWQVPRGKFVATGFHAGILRVLTAAAALRTPPRLHFSEDVATHKAMVMHRFIGARVASSANAKYASHFVGCARGLSDPRASLHYRSLTLRSFSLHDKVSSRTQILYVLRGRVSWLNSTALRSMAGDYHADANSVEFERRPYREQVALVSSSNILVAAHGSSLVHIPLLSPPCAVMELFACNHTSLIYRNLAVNTGCYYRAVYEDIGCSLTPVMHTDDTRRYMHLRHKIPDVVARASLARAVRYVYWRKVANLQLDGR